MAAKILTLFSLLFLTTDAAFHSTLLRAGGTNLNNRLLPQYSLSTASPTLTWSIVESDNATNAAPRGVQPLSYVLKLHDVSENVSLFESNEIRSAVTKHSFSDFPPVLQAGHLYTWTVSGKLSNNHTYAAAVLSAPGAFRISLLTDQSWDAVAWLGSTTYNVYQTHVTVTEASKPVDAVLYIAGLGYSNIKVNGKKVGANHLVTAPWTANERLIGFSALDVTDNLVVGINTITVMLGNGWREQTDFKSQDPNELGGDTIQKVVRAQLFLSTATAPATYTGDGTWKAAVGPVTYDSVYNGETYNASHHIVQWSTAPVLTKKQATRGKSTSPIYCTPLLFFFLIWNCLYYRPKCDFNS